MNQRRDQTLPGIGGAKAIAHLVKSRHYNLPYIRLSELILERALSSSVREAMRLRRDAQSNYRVWWLSITSAISRSRDSQL